MTKNNEPTNKFRLGTVCVNEWTNKAKDSNGKETEWLNYSINASYYDKEKEEYKETTSLSEAQLSKLLVCIGEALSNNVKNK